MQIFQTSTSDIGIERVGKVRQSESQILRLVRCWLYEVRWTKSGDCPKKNLQERGKSAAAKKLQREKVQTRKMEKRKKLRGSSLKSGGTFYFYVADLFFLQDE